MAEDIHIISGPAFIFDPASYYILDANQFFTELYGYTVDELKTMRIFHLRPPEEWPHAISIMEATKDNVIYSGESNHRKKNGETFRVHVFGKRILEGNKEIFMVKISVKEKD